MISPARRKMTSESLAQTGPIQLLLIVIGIEKVNRRNPGLFVKLSHWIDLVNTIALGRPGMDAARIARAEKKRELLNQLAEADD